MKQQQIATTHLPDPIRAIQTSAPVMLGNSFDDFVERLRKQHREGDIQHLRACWDRIDQDYAPPSLPYSDI